MTIALHDSQASGEMIESLSPAEINEFARLEKQIGAGMKSFLSVGEALIKIREGNLYRADFGSFREYCEARWGLGRQWAYKLITATETTKNLEAAGLPAPTAPSQVGPIAGLPADVQREVYAAAVEGAEGRVPGEAQVQEAAEAAGVVKARKPRVKKAEIDPAAGMPVMPGTPITADEAKSIREGVRLGAVPEGASVEVRDLTGGDPAPEVSPIGDTAEEAKPEEAKPEVDYPSLLEKLPERKKLSDVVRKQFDAAAVAFWKCADFRSDFRAACKPFIESAKRAAKGHIGPWMDRHMGYLSAKSPKDWRACVTCQGSGQMELVGKCADCRGHGYHAN